MSVKMEEARTGQNASVGADGKGQGSYRTVRKWKGKKIVIDLADVPFPLGSGLEVAVLYASNAKEIEIVPASDMDEAVKIYEQMLEKYPEGQSGGRAAKKNNG